MVGVLLYAACSGWQRRSDSAPLPTLTTATATTSAPEPPIDADALNLLFGLMPSHTPVVSATPLVLHASIVGAPGQSRALLASGAVHQFYREGVRLPDGSVLRAIHVDRVVLWRNGREESLLRERSNARHFTPASPRATVPRQSAAPTPLLRPTSELEP